MPPIFSGSTGLHVFLVEHQVPEVRGGVEVDYEGFGVGVAGGVLAVDGLHMNQPLPLPTVPDLCDYSTHLLDYSQLRSELYRL